MLLLGISAKKSRPSAHTGPSIHLNPETMRSIVAPAGTILSIEASSRSNFSGVTLSAGLSAMAALPTAADPVE